MPVQMVVLVGLTGSGKTDLLHLLAADGEQVLDMERLAAHRGSAFGALTSPGTSQPTNRAFIASVYEHLASFDSERPVWSEYKGAHIGSVSVPPALLTVQRTSPQVEVVRAAATRAAALVGTYGHAPSERWLQAVARIRGRLGAVPADLTTDLVRAGQLGAAVDLLLPYYDGGYLAHRRSLTGRVIAHVDIDAGHAGEAATPCRHCSPTSDAP